MIRPRVLAVDLDGTLLDREGAPHPADMRAIRAAMAAGVGITIVTGRLFPGTRHVAEVLGVTGPVCCADGSHLVDTRTGETLAHRGIRGPDALGLQQAVGRARAATYAFTREAIVYDAGGDTFLEYLAAWSPTLERAASVLDHAVWQGDEGVTAVVAVGEASGIGEAAAEIRAELAHAVQVLTFPMGRQSTWALMARAAGSSKGAALEPLARHFGATPAETVVVGDWVNDISMFEAAGRSYCMGHAPDQVKRAASDVLTETRDSGGGVARAVAESFGIAPSRGPRQSLG